MKRAARTLLVGTSLALAAAGFGVSDGDIDWPSPGTESVATVAASTAERSAGNIDRSTEGNIDWPAPGARTLAAADAGNAGDIDWP
ncbi:hypothetical protein [Streptomyces sp. NPDC058308]|uniref:hypothetical protein n=1 Tax=Streptomyces sp. NPDC058308 TaxID=3346440 RepID=UPI0036EE95BE